MWKKFCDHTVKVEEEYWKKDGLVEDVVEEILITVGEGDEEPDNDDVHYHSTGSSGGSMGSDEHPFLTSSLVLMPV